MLIPAGIVQHIEPCMNYGRSLWYLFQTITTIGFGDVIAGQNQYCADLISTLPHDFSERLKIHPPTFIVKGS